MDGRFAVEMKEHIKSCVEGGGLGAEDGKEMKTKSCRP
jgi:hypothetical protein